MTAELFVTFLIGCVVGGIAASFLADRMRRWGRSKRTATTFGLATAAILIFAAVYPVAFGG